MDFLKVFAASISKFFGGSEESTPHEAHAALEKVAAKTFEQHLADAKSESAAAVADLTQKFSALQTKVEGLEASVLEKDTEIATLKTEIQKKEETAAATAKKHETEVASLNQKIAQLTARGIEKNEGEEATPLSIGSGKNKETVVILPESQLGKMMGKKK